MALQAPEASPEGAVQLEFGLTDPSYPFIGATVATDATLDMEEMVPRSDGSYAEFFTVSGADPQRILELAEDHETSTGRVLSADDDGGLIEFVVETDCPAVCLADAGAIPRVVHSEDGRGRVVAEVPDEVDTNAVTATFLSTFPAADLLARRQHEPGASPFRDGGLPDALAAGLSDRQREVIEAAHQAGYYEWPRDVTAEELAAELDVSPPTFHQHRRAAERKLVELLVSAGETTGTGPDATF